MPLPAAGFFAAPVIAGNAMTALRMAGAVAGLAGVGKGIYDAGQRSGKKEALSAQARHNQALNQMYGASPKMPMSGYGMPNPYYRYGSYTKMSGPQVPIYGGNHAPVSIGNPYSQYLPY